MIRDSERALPTPPLAADARSKLGRTSGLAGPDSEEGGASEREPPPSPCPASARRERWKLEGREKGGGEGSERGAGGEQGREKRKEVRQ